MDPQTQQLIQIIQAQHPGTSVAQALQILHNLQSPSGPSQQFNPYAGVGNAVGGAANAIGSSLPPLPGMPSSPDPSPTPFGDAVRGPQPASPQAQAPDPTMSGNPGPGYVNPGSPLPQGANSFTGAGGSMANAGPSGGPPPVPDAPPQTPQPQAPQGAPQPDKSVTTQGDSSKGPNQGPPPPGGAASPAAQTGAASGPGFQGTDNQDARNEQVFGMSTQDLQDPRGWADRVFQMDQRSKGNDLNLATNPLAGGPWSQFVKSRYGTDMPMQALMGTLENPSDGLFSGAIRDQMQHMALGGGSPASGVAGLQNVGQLMGRAMSGDSGLDPAQSSRLQGLANNPSLSGQMILSQLQGHVGGLGMGNVAGKLAGLQDLYYQDPYNHDPSVGGNKVPFYNQAMKMLGMG